jgi:hypothetical protein
MNTVQKHLLELTHVKELHQNFSNIYPLNDKICISFRKKTTIVIGGVVTEIEFTLDDIKKLKPVNVIDEENVVSLLFEPSNKDKFDVICKYQSIMGEFERPVSDQALANLKNSVQLNKANITELELQIEHLKKEIEKGQQRVVEVEAENREFDEAMSAFNLV